MIAQCILAAGVTVPDEHMRLASLHCTFIEGGKPQPPIHYVVHRANDCTVRSVRAFQGTKCILIAALRFEPRSQPYSAPPPAFRRMAADATKATEIKGGGGAKECPFVCSDLSMLNAPSDCVPQEMKIWQQMKTRQSMATDDRSLHIAAVAYMSDNYFLPTVTRVHGLCWERDPESLPESLFARRQKDDTKKVKMMVSLDHSIYFAQTNDEWRADHWLHTEMQSPWAGDGRGLVVQRIYSERGILICTAVQEVIHSLRLLLTLRTSS